MNTSMQARVALDSRDKLGEGPVWDAKQQRLLWQDHGAELIREAKSANGRTWRETRQWSTHRPIAASIPRAQGGLVVPGGTEVFFMDDNGTFTSFATLQNCLEGTRINDAKCDARGRLWAGTLTSAFKSGGGALYRIDADGSVSIMLKGVTLANGLDWSPDNRTFYFIDSFTRRIDAFDFDLDSGTITNRRTFAHVQRGAPNGMTVDVEGCIWVASTGGGNVQRYSPQGEYLTCIDVATPGATSCAFGGPACTDLFITSRAGRMPDAALQLGVPPNMLDNNGPAAGALFICQPGTQGLPAHDFAG